MCVCVWSRRERKREGGERADLNTSGAEREEGAVYASGSEGVGGVP